MSENLPHRAATPAPPMEAADWTGELPSRIGGSFPEIAFAFKAYLDQNFILLPAAEITQLVRHLRDHECFDMLTDLTAVDYPKDALRFEIVYELYSFTGNHRLRLKIRSDEATEIPSIVSVFSAANWLEREVYDMFGIRFSGHPDLKRILLPEEWQGFPLRKDKAITAMDNDWVQANLGIESGQ